MLKVGWLIEYKTNLISHKASSCHCLLIDKILGAHNISIMKSIVKRLRSIGR